MLHKIFLKSVSFIKSKVQVAVNVVLIFMVSIGIFIPTFTSAAVLASASDTMTNETASGTSDHTFAWTQAAGHAYVANDSITIASSTASNFTSAGSWATSDFTLTMAGIGATHIQYAASSAGTCTAGAGNYGIVYTNSTTPTFVVNLCASFGTATTAGTASLLIKGGTGTGTLTNKSTAVASAPWTITDAGSNTDSTTIADVVVTNDVVTVNATVNPTLTFSLGSNSVNLFTLSSASTSVATATISASTNGAGGFVLSYNGPTLTSGANVITAWGAQSVPVTGATQFGINIGTTPTTNAGACTAASSYNDVTKYAYVASTTTSLTNESAPADCVFTVKYAADIATTTPAGAYSTAIAYLASATF